MQMSRFYADLMFDNEMQRNLWDIPEDKIDEVRLDNMRLRYERIARQLRTDRKARKYSARLFAIGIGLERIKGDILAKISEKVVAVGVSIPTEKLATVGITSILTAAGVTLGLEQIKVMDDKRRMRNLGHNAIDLAHRKFSSVPGWALEEAGSDQSLY
jgi:hypothetical protein